MMGYATVTTPKVLPSKPIRQKAPLMTEDQLRHAWLALRKRETNGRKESEKWMPDHFKESGSRGGSSRPPSKPSKRQLEVLAVMGRDRLTARQVADRMGWGVKSVGNLLRRLQEHGLTEPVGSTRGPLGPLKVWAAIQDEQEPVE